MPFWWLVALKYICSMKDKDKLAPLLRAFKLGHVDFDYAMDFILHIYSVSRRFNWSNFSLGMAVGGILMLIALHFTS